ncbi:hypothetical protein CspeluHIS016_0210550 [Cutaneotrichosporon spelunceum]|uniref:Uncharacterized protein n=1 Tax=Cutaneotrichosporon spelunceum TaxID=1672016 RepID=A0AAD3TSU4_9TREE|nr:hypothetical protein CspeluHIS016_0210550 [Cutaneotrichosporon spelunceum]
MSHRAQTPDANLPAALTQLFAEGDHFLRPSEDMLLDSGLEDSQTVAAIAAAAEQAAEHVGQAEGEHAEAQQIEQHGQLGHEQLDQEHHVLSHQQLEQHLEPELGPHDIDLAPPEKQSALEVLASSLRAESDRLRRAVSHLEAQGLGLEAALPALPLEMDVDGLDISQHTLRELASAAAGEAFFPALGSLHSLQVEEENPATVADFLHGLVAQVTVPRAGEGRPKVDPFEVARRGIEAEIEATRAAIIAKEVEIEAAKGREGEATGASSPEDKAALDAQSTKVASALEAARARAAVLRDAVLRIKRERDAAHLAVLGMEAELAVMGDEARPAASVRALTDVRSYLEDVLKNYKEKGKLPAPPLPSLPPLMLAAMAPPSSLPKKRGRPPRSATRPSVVPAQLAHLVPEQDEIAARAGHAPIRRKGVKRNKIELEREAARISEETEMMKSLARMGVWKGDEWVAGA